MQSKAVLTFVEAIQEKTLRSTVVMTAARYVNAQTSSSSTSHDARYSGRGKSAALGLCMAGAVAYGYANIFVTAPSPENLKTLFEMVFKGQLQHTAPQRDNQQSDSGFDALDYKEHVDYEIVQSTNPAFGKAVVRVNIFRAHRQTIQYIQPHDHSKLSQAGVC